MSVLTDANRRRTLAIAAVTALTGALLTAAPRADGEEGGREATAGAIRCANLIYGRGATSECFASQFLVDAAEQTHIRTTGRFTPTNLDSEALYETPFAVMSGDKAFTLTPDQRRNLHRYLTTGGFLLASAGCSSVAWDRSFRREIGALFPGAQLEQLQLDHPVFHTVYDIEELKMSQRSETGHLEGLSINGRLVLVYTPDGLNDTASIGGDCCCCGGSEILNARQVNLNILAYALTH